MLMIDHGGSHISHHMIYQSDESKRTKNNQILLS